MHAARMYGALLCRKLFHVDFIKLTKINCSCDGMATTYSEHYSSKCCADCQSR
jgi:hypothetical protein